MAKKNYLNPINCWQIEPGPARTKTIHWAGSSYSNLFGFKPNIRATFIHGL